MCVCVRAWIQYHKEARDTQDLLNRLDKELDQKYNPEFKDIYQMEGLINEIDVCTLYFVFLALVWANYGPGPICGPLRLFNPAHQT